MTEPENEDRKTRIFLYLYDKHWKELLEANVGIDASAAEDGRRGCANADGRNNEWSRQCVLELELEAVLLQLDKVSLTFRDEKSDDSDFTRRFKVGRHFYKDWKSSSGNLQRLLPEAALLSAQKSCEKSCEKSSHAGGRKTFLRLIAALTEPALCKSEGQEHDRRRDLAVAAATFHAHILADFLEDFVYFDAGENLQGKFSLENFQDGRSLGVESLEEILRTLQDLVAAIRKGDLSAPLCPRSESELKDWALRLWRPLFTNDLTETAGLRLKADSAVCDWSREGSAVVSHSASHLNRICKGDQIYILEASPSATLSTPSDSPMGGFRTSPLNPDLPSSVEIARRADAGWSLAFHDPLRLLTSDTANLGLAPESDQHSTVDVSLNRVLRSGLRAGWIPSCVRHSIVVSPHRVSTPHQLSPEKNEKMEDKEKEKGEEKGEDKEKDLSDQYTRRIHTLLSLGLPPDIRDHLNSPGRTLHESMGCAAEVTPEHRIAATTLLDRLKRDAEKFDYTPTDVLAVSFPPENWRNVKKGDKDRRGERDDTESSREDSMTAPTVASASASVSLSNPSQLPMSQDLLRNSAERLAGLGASEVSEAERLSGLCERGAARLIQISWSKGQLLAKAHRAGGLAELPLLSVRSGEVVRIESVSDDGGWLCVDRRATGERGFIPSCLLKTPLQIFQSYLDRYAIDSHNSPISHTSHIDSQTSVGEVDGGLGVVMDENGARDGAAGCEPGLHDRSKSLS